MCIYIYIQKKKTSSQSASYVDPCCSLQLLDSQQHVPPLQFPGPCRRAGGSFWQVLGENFGPPISRRMIIS